MPLQVSEVILPSRRHAIEYILTGQDEVQEEDNEEQGVPRMQVASADVVFTPPNPRRLDKKGLLFFLAYPPPAQVART